MRTALGIAIAVWTLLAWGGRIGLLVDGDGMGAWIRIGGSIVIGLFAAATLVFDQLEPARRAALVVFALWCLVIWSRSLFVNWTGDGSLSFKLVHTVLGVGFFVLGALGMIIAFTGGTSELASSTGRSDVVAAASHEVVDPPRST